MTDRFKLTDGFVGKYKDMKPPFGFVDAAGTSLGEITFLRTYSRLKTDGTKETWTELCRRVIEGMYEIQRQHVVKHNLPWSGAKAQSSAREAFDSMWHMHWLPPGRGLWSMGTELTLSGNAAPLQNCAWVSTAEMTKNDPGHVFAWMMEASMLGIGVGFDGEGAKKGFTIQHPVSSTVVQIADTREGWAASLAQLVNALLVPGKPMPVFDYSLIRPAGSPIHTFGGTASGPGPLKVLHESVLALFEGRAVEQLTLTDIADIGNLIGVCVVAGNVRRSAEMFLGPATPEFLGLKDYAGAGARRSAWSYMSNNSVRADASTDLESLVPGILANGEPGVVWLDTVRSRGRLVDPPNHDDHRVSGTNPCSEQFLESWECCTLAETFPTNCASLADYERALKFAFLYAKTVTLMSTPWPETNAVMLRNRRIGLGMSGAADFVDERGYPELIEWQDAGYTKVKQLDRTYSEWLGVRESIRVTTIKPSGTVSLLAGVSPGVHWQPGSKHYFRLMRVRKGDPLAEAAKWSNYRVEPAVSDPEGTEVIYFPMVRSSRRGEHDVPLVEKAALAETAQKFWSDNGVSVTLTYNEDEASQLGDVLRRASTRMKSVSFLPLSGGGYEQMPYTQANEDDVEAATMTHLPINTSLLYLNGAEALGEKFCTTDSCEVPSLTERNHE